MMELSDSDLRRFDLFVELLFLNPKIIFSLFEVVCETGLLCILLDRETVESVLLFLEIIQLFLFCFELILNFNEVLKSFTSVLDCLSVCFFICIKKSFRLLGFNQIFESLFLLLVVLDHSIDKLHLGSDCFVESGQDEVDSVLIAFFYSAVCIDQIVKL